MQWINRKIAYGIVAALATLAVILSFIIRSRQANQDARIIFLDVGQGDATLIRSGSTEILIDGGPSGERLLQKVGEFMPFWDKEIETVVITHPDQDHIGGLPRLFESYKVDSVVRTHQRSESKTFRALEETIRAEGSQEIEAKRGVRFKISDDDYGDIIYPDRSLEEAAGDDTNSGSVVIEWRWKSEKFLLAGDLPDEAESAALAGCGSDCDVDVLKVSHHGSKYATTDAWLDATKPEVAVISVGPHNSFGHPAPETLERLRSHAAKILETAQLGDLVFVCQPENQRCYLEQR